MSAVRLSRDFHDAMRVPSQEHMQETVFGMKDWSDVGDMIGAAVFDSFTFEFG